MQEAVKDRYVTFENIDCYQNARDVLDAMKELFVLYPQAKNNLWIKFFEQIPENYQEELAKMDCKDILYQVCSNVFYISDLFEEYDFEKGIKLLDQAELECC
jgi:hypothetical protein